MDRLYNHQLYNSFSFLFTSTYFNIIKNGKSSRTDEHVIDKLVNILDYIKQSGMYDIQFTERELVEFGKTIHVLGVKDGKIAVVNDLSACDQTLFYQDSIRYVKFAGQTYLNIYKQNPGNEQIISFCYAPTFHPTRMFKYMRVGSEQTLNLYPERILMLYFITDSKISTAIFKMARPFINERTIKKVDIISTSEADTLYKKYT